MRASYGFLWFAWFFYFAGLFRDIVQSNTERATYCLALGCFMLLMSIRCQIIERKS